MVFDQTHTTSGHGNRPFWDVHCLQRDFAARLALEFPLDAEAIQGWDLLCSRFCAVIQRLEDDALDQIGRQIRIIHALQDFIPQIRSKRFHRREEDAAVLAVNGSAHRRRIVHKIKHPIGLRHAVDVQPVHAQQLKQERAVERISWNVVEVDTGSRVVVPDVQSEILLTQSERLHGVDVLHHDFPKRRRIAIAQT